MQNPPIHPRNLVCSRRQRRLGEEHADGVTKCLTSNLVSLGLPWLVCLEIGSVNQMTKPEQQLRTLKERWKEPKPVTEAFGEIVTRPIEITCEYTQWNGRVTGQHGPQEPCESDAGMTMGEGYSPGEDKQDSRDAEAWSSVTILIITPTSEFNPPDAVPPLS